MKDKKVILIVEDEAMVRDALNDLLVSEGFSILEAKNGEEGLKMALSDHPDLILIDVQLPKIDGLTMLRKIRENEQGKHIKFIIITNGDGVEGVERARDIAGVPKDEPFEYFIKVNLSIEEVFKKIKDILGIK
jgi:CheY-like chemotaxis protein